MRSLPAFGTFLVAALLLVWATAPARAATLIRDSDVENALARLAAPILQASGLGGTVRLLLIDDPSLNAFVVDSGHIYIHTGLLMRLDTPEKLQGVIAHEAAHIANGHITRRMTNLDSARTAAGLGLALALAAAAATGRGDVAGALALGTQTSAQRQFFAHTRAEEASADQSGVRYMATAGIDPVGMLEVQQLFEGQEHLNVTRQDPYMRSHPLTRDRIRAMERFVSAYSGSARAQPELDYWYDRARAKATAFQRPPKWTFQRYRESPAKDVQHMRLAVAHHRQQERSKALDHIGKAIELRPNDAQYYDLKGQILLQGRQFQSAVTAYRTAADFAPRDPLILGNLGRALLTIDRPKEALQYLEKSRSLDFRNMRVLRDLGSAYAQVGNNGMASVSTAERYALAGRLQDAEIHAQRALGLLPRGSSAYRRAQDILAAAKRANRKKR
ncbi:putative Zn-dependent protease [Shimia isoporae]|uniref:Putative Zn-dependent protease n=1 Tax=Shimia isoporae TaxID=647720 RepID=A0A4R1NSJ4_9RHOB|nr:M48 family metalloprotease [Shimia isoporae]TCL09753.1 putative Zn-dependent protease [Shimia isoporae]